MNATAALGRYRDQLLAAGLGALYAFEVLFSGEVAHHLGSAAAVAVLAAGSLVVRRTKPLLPLMAVITVVQLNHTVLPGLAEGGSFMVVLMVAIYSAGGYLRGRMLVLGAVVVGGIIPLAALDPRQPPGLSDWIFFGVFLGAPFVAGVVFRRRRERDQEVAEIAQRVEEESATRASEAVAAERARISRELHDVVAHAISVIVVQARGGRRAAEGDTDAARRAFDVIERAGEQALAEMRRLLMLLRVADGEEPELEPQPHLGRIKALAEALASTGLPVEIVTEGDPVDLSPGLELSAYRIVQEALTNALKHAGPAHAQVVLRYLPGALELEVVDDGDGTGAGGGSGHGLTGIRERVDVFGGQLSAGARPGGGFAVRARLPMEAPS